MDYKNKAPFYIKLFLLLNFFCLPPSKANAAGSPSSVSKPKIKEREKKAQGIAEAPCYQVNTSNLGEDVQLSITEENISYEFNFEEDDRNFCEQPCQFVGVLKEWLILVNFHGDAEVNLFKVFDSDRDRGKRSWAWGTPYIWAGGAIRTVGDIHDHLALPRLWSDKKVRKKVSFLFIPPGTYVNLKIGYAASQIVQGKEDSLPEDRLGFGLQIRWNALPRGTLVLTAPLLKFQTRDRNSKRKVRGGKETISFCLQEVLEGILGFYHEQMSGNPLALEIIHQILASNEATSLSGVNPNDLEQLMGDTFGLTCIKQ